LGGKAVTEAERLFRERPNVVSLFAYMGVDVYNSDHIEDLRLTLDHAKKQRIKYERRSSRRLMWFAVAGMVLFGCALTLWTFALFRGMA
jgi:hypothetical protein